MRTQTGDSEAHPPGNQSEANAYAAIKAALEGEWAIGNHTHIVYRAHYDERFFAYMALAMRQVVPEQRALSRTLFSTDAPKEAAAVRNARIKPEGGAYWIRHLDATRARIAPVNTMATLPDTGGQPRPIPFATCPLFPVPAKSYVWDPPGKDIVARARAWQAGHAVHDGRAPADLAAYLAFVHETLAAYNLVRMRNFGVAG